MDALYVVALAGILVGVCFLVYGSLLMGKAMRLGRQGAMRRAQSALSVGTVVALLALALLLLLALVSWTT